LGLPGLNGVEVLRRLRHDRISARVLIYSGTSNQQLIVEALKCRPEGFVEKTASITVLRNAINAVLDGCSYFTPTIAPLLYEVRLDAQSALQLTARERTILQMVGEGNSSKEIADSLGLAVKTVDNARARIMEKLSLPNTAALVRHALAMGMISVA
jgi:DNA-binding NarL/FixJ family response regulator